MIYVARLLTIYLVIQGGYVFDMAIHQCLMAQPWAGLILGLFSIVLWVVALVILLFGEVVLSSSKLRPPIEQCDNDRHGCLLQRGHDGPCKRFRDFDV